MSSEIPESELCVVEQDQENIDITLSDNILIDCARTGDLDQLIDCFDNAESPYHETVNDLLNSRSNDGKSPMDIASILGQLEIVAELIKRGSNLNHTSSKGYSPVHLASAWNKLTVLQCLVNDGGDIHSKTTHGETPRDIAVRYGWNECVWYLDWALERENFLAFINDIKDTVNDPERLQGRLNKEEKNQTLTICNESVEWVETITDHVVIEDFREKDREVQFKLEAILQKLSEPPPEKGHKK